MPKIDEMGVMRHTWNRERLESLYNELCNYITDCDQQEFEKLNSAFIEIKTSIHQRMNNQ